MDAVSRRVYEFEGFTIDMMRRTLRTLEQEIELRPRSFDVLCCLVEHAGRLVTKREFFRRVWPGVNVSDKSLARCVSDIRLAIGDRQQRMIKTMPGRGYLLAVAAAPLPDGIGEVPAIGETGVALATDPIRGVAAGIDGTTPSLAAEE